MGSLDFCCNCGEWIGAVKFGDKIRGGGKMRQGPDGEPEIICSDCEAIEKSHACPIEPGSRSGMLGDIKAKQQAAHEAL